MTELSTAAERPRALVVDDDDPIRLMLAKLLERQNISVDTARDGGEAIERLKEDGYRVVLLDLMMPRVDGYAVLRYMKENEPALLSCTIIASAVPQRDVLEQLGEAVYRIHTKPFDVTRLLEDVRRCVAPQ
jgi:CheY-like chemotaxis protein